MKENKFMVVISVLSLIFVVLGATFSFFSVNRNSDEGAVTAKAATVGINLSVTPLYNEKKLIPMNDSDIWKAYGNNCVDIYEYGACQAYLIDIENVGQELEYHGFINFTINGIKNLNYMLLDENNEVYVPQQRISDEGSENMTLGDSFVLQENEARQFKLLIWLSNYDYDQNSIDGGGNFNASVTYEAVNGYKITGSISGS